MKVQPLLQIFSTSCVNNAAPIIAQHVNNYTFRLHVKIATNCGLERQKLVSRDPSSTGWGRELLLGAGDKDVAASRARNRASEQD